MNARPSPSEGESLSDVEREELIELYRQILVADPDTYCKRHAQARMRELIGERSAGQIARMEAARDLR